MNMNMVGYNIVNAMHKRGVSVRELAHRTQVDRGNLGERINHPEKMKLTMLIRIAKAIGVDFRELLDGVE